MKALRKRGGSALVIVLCAIVLASVMVLTVLVGARLERQSAHYHAERTRAEAMAQSAFAQAVSLLRSATDGTNTWLSEPGRIVPVTFGSTTPYGTPVDLFSGIANTSLSDVYQTPNLNAARLDGTYPLDPSGSTMRVKWIYVRRDGTLDLSDTPTKDQSNPIIGRYAFWVDDASSRINLNTAWTRSTNNTTPPTDPSRINLEAATNFPADEVHTNVVNALLNSSFDLRSSNIVRAVTTNRWAYTVFNHSSELNPFGEPKIYLTTQKNNLPAGFTNVANYTNYFLDILATENTDPGSSDNIDDTKTARVVNRLYTYLTRKDWPVYPGTSFAKKYWDSDTDPRTFQLAVNIVEYVRAKESAQKIVNAIRGYVSGGQFTSITKSYQNNNAIFPSSQPMPLIGITRSPVITETALYYCRSGWGDPGVGFQAEIFLPPNIGIDQLNSGDFKLSRQFISDLPIGGGTYNDRWDSLSFSASIGGDGTFWPVASAGRPTFPLAPGQYIKVECWHINGQTKNNLKTYPTANFRSWLGITTPNHSYALTSSSSLDYWGASLTNSRGVGPTRLSTNTVNTPPANTWQVNDPAMACLNVNSVQTASTWGEANTSVSTLGSSPSSTAPPQQDTDVDGKITDIGWRLPYPAGTTQNPTGRVDSLSELGYVNTGVVCWTNTDGKNGVPYRTLRLQPSSGVTLPDWALLDVFAIPLQSTAYTRQPYPWKNTLQTYGSVGGRLNLNGTLQPFTSVLRTQPLLALLTDAKNPMTSTNISASSAATMATNILQRNLAAHGQAYDSTNILAHIGQLAELSGLADGGEASEGNLFEPLALTTVNGNVFLVYVVGQALQQLPSGTLKVNGEKCYEFMLERVPSTAPGQSGLMRTISTRELTP